MHVTANGTLYDVYVKNDYFCKRSQDSKEHTTVDLELDRYINKVQASIPELKDASAVSVHILPESSADKSSGSTEDVSDDIIGVVSCSYHYEADEEGSTATNIHTDGQYNKSSIKNLLDKLKFVYRDDTSLSGALNTYSTTKYKVRDMGNGYQEFTADIPDSDPFHGEISNLNDMLSSDGSANAKDPMTLLLERLMESLKQENEKSFLDPSSASNKRLAYVFSELQKDKQQGNV
ncbi:MAG: hypothetical protein PHE67_03265 [Campylobacterales bacterium]|nr:hypothetical protein [Campylobacterales bacterium]